MLGLKLPTDPRWVNIVEKNIDDILTDHAFCEQKAASTAISLIVGFPEYTELVSEMTALVREEMGHFKMVHDLIIARGQTLGRDRKDSYVIALLSFFPKGGSRTTQLVHRLLIAALIEARSCERFRLLSEELEDTKLREFYKKLMISEAGHYTMFLKFARLYGDRKEVDEKWESLLIFEAQIMKDLFAECFNVLLSSAVFNRANTIIQNAIAGAVLGFLYHSNELIRNTARESYNFSALLLSMNASAPNGAFHPPSPFGNVSTEADILILRRTLVRGLRSSR